ncbi:MAG: hypothetical protein DCC59_15435 [Chloroflexi bacterium]|nr:hypothetical protein [Chloroflexi bacterium CFX1]MCQ3953455.1 hypothetical protein [Chloroflexota bacterium]RIK48217.1 MAG: hypothetical protein DCC59_15435 [Chloroflexota bacterium]
MISTVCPRAPEGLVVVAVDDPSCNDVLSAPGQYSATAILSVRLGTANRDGPIMKTATNRIPLESRQSKTQAMMRATQTSFNVLSFMRHL